MPKDATTAKSSRPPETAQLNAARARRVRRFLGVVAALAPLPRGRRKVTSAADAIVRGTHHSVVTSCNPCMLAIGGPRDAMLKPSRPSRPAANWVAVEAKTAQQGLVATALEGVRKTLRRVRAPGTALPDTALPETSKEAPKVDPPKGVQKTWRAPARDPRDVRAEYIALMQRRAAEEGATLEEADIAETSDGQFAAVIPGRNAGSTTTITLTADAHAYALRTVGLNAPRVYAPRAHGAAPRGAQRRRSRRATHRSAPRARARRVGANARAAPKSLDPPPPEEPPPEPQGARDRRDGGSS